jgi:hypothetical protein
MLLILASCAIFVCVLRCARRRLLTHAHRCQLCSSVNYSSSRFRVVRCRSSLSAATGDEAAGKRKRRNRKIRKMASRRPQQSGGHLGWRRRGTLKIGKWRSRRPRQSGRQLSRIKGLLHQIGPARSAPVSLRAAMVCWELSQSVLYNCLRRRLIVCAVCGSRQMLRVSRLPAAPTVLVTPYRQKCSKQEVPDPHALHIAHIDLQASPTYARVISCRCVRALSKLVCEHVDTYKRTVYLVKSQDEHLTKMGSMYYLSQ